MSLIIHRTCLLLLACVALSHAPFVPAEEECQVVSSVKSINNGLLRREAMREVSTDIAGKRTGVMPRQNVRSGVGDLPGRAQDPPAGGRPGPWK